MALVFPRLWVEVLRTVWEILSALRRRFVETTASTRQSAASLAVLPFYALMGFVCNELARLDGRLSRGLVGSTSSWTKNSAEFGGAEVMKCGFLTSEHYRGADSLCR